MNGFDHAFFGMGYMTIIPLLIILFLIFVFRDRSTERSTAQDILDRRFANGGISKEEYEDKSTCLRQSKDGAKT